MKSPFTFTRPAALASACLLALAFTLAAPGAHARGDKDWKPVDPADLAASAPGVEKGADANRLRLQLPAAICLLPAQFKIGDERQVI